MRIIDKHNDFYDYFQNIYKDDTITFDRTDSFVLTKEIMCNNLRHSSGRSKYRFLLLQVCNTFWLFLGEITKTKTNCGIEEIADYNIKLICTWKNYFKPKALIKFDSIGFDYEIKQMLYKKKYDIFFEYCEYSIDKIYQKTELLQQAINGNQYETKWVMTNERVTLGDGSVVKKHIPILKSSGIVNEVKPLDIYLAFEEYFCSEKTASERVESVGLTDKEKIENHGFDNKTSFRH